MGLQVVYSVRWFVVSCRIIGREWIMTRLYEAYLCFIARFHWKSKKGERFLPALSFFHHINFEWCYTWSLVIIYEDDRNARRHVERSQACNQDVLITHLLVVLRSILFYRPISLLCIAGNTRGDSNIEKRSNAGKSSINEGCLGPNNGFKADSLSVNKSQAIVNISRFVPSLLWAFVLWRGLILMGRLISNAFVTTSSY